MSYNKDIDYQEKINEAVKNGDYVSAAEYEKSRNEKIDGEKLSYEKTNRYSGWLDKTDYSIVLRDQMDNGASRQSVANTLAKRVNKASGTDGLIKYARDEVYDEAVRYIMGESSFDYQKSEPTYSGKYDKKIEALYRELADAKFSYNPLEDELYQYYKDAYFREGNRAMEDLLGELAVNTGGVASSYAASAAAQSRNYYNEKLTDKIPELYTAAYERYLDDLGVKEENLKSLLDIREDDYDFYLDSLSQFNKNREYEYNKFLDDREYQKYLREEEREEEKYRAEEKRKDEEFEYQKFLDEREYQKYLDGEARKDKEFEYQKSVDDREYQKYLDDESRKEKEFEYQKIVDDRNYQLSLTEEERKKDEFAYKKYADNRDYQNLLKEQQRQETDRAHNRSQDSIKWAIEKWQTMGYLDEESAEILGLPAGTHTVEYDYKQAQQYKIYNK